MAKIAPQDCRCGGAFFCTDGWFIFFFFFCRGFSVRWGEPFSWEGRSCGDCAPLAFSLLCFSGFHVAVRSRRLLSTRSNSSRTDWPQVTGQRKTNPEAAKARPSPFSRQEIATSYTRNDACVLFRTPRT